MINLQVSLAYNSMGSGSNKITATDFKNLLDLLGKISTDKIRFTFSSNSIETLHIIPDEKPTIDKKEYNKRFTNRKYLKQKLDINKPASVMLADLKRNKK